MSDTSPTPAAPGGCTLDRLGRRLAQALEELPLEPDVAARLTLAREKALLEARARYSFQTPFERHGDLADRAG